MRGLLCEVRRKGLSVDKGVKVDKYAEKNLKILCLKDEICGNCENDSPRSIQNLDVLLASFLHPRTVVEKKHKP